ncbi:ABC transporter ATP-binding protein [Inquilinus sp. CA228]|uniref:ABC transporter ATP-binding protein n=1 Tax=Inquilinus sp. CA228 TaxID=3455609 RepID=UPI003F8D3A81
MPHVQIQNVSKTFGLKVNGQTLTARALDGVSFEVEQGEVVALAGPSGCGKTTALRIIMGLESASSGAVTVGNRAIAGCGHDRGMVFQHAELLPWKTVLENVKFGLAMKGVPKSELDGMAARYVELVGLSHAKDRRPHQLSGGMKQRVGIARALAIDPEVLLMDEPFGALDSQTRETLQMELLTIHERTRKTIIFVTHDLDEAVLLADRVVVLNAGRVQEIIPIDLGRPRRDIRAIQTNPEFMRKRTMIWEALHESGPAEDRLTVRRSA